MSGSPSGAGEAPAWWRPECELYPHPPVPPRLEARPGDVAVTGYVRQSWQHYDYLQNLYDNNVHLAIEGSAESEFSHIHHTVIFTSVQGDRDSKSLSIDWHPDLNTRENKPPTYLGHGTDIGPFATIGHGVQAEGFTRIDARAVIGNRSRIGLFAIIGSAVELGVATVVGEQVIIRSGVSTGSSTKIGSNSIIGSGSTLDKDVTLAPHTVLGDNVKIDQSTSLAVGAGHNTVIGMYCDIHADIGDGVTIGMGSRLGPDAYIRDGAILETVTVGKQAEVGIRTILEEGCFIDHDAVIGNGAKLAKNVTIGGNSEVGVDVVIDQNTVVGANCSIGARAIIGFGCSVGDRVRIDKNGQVDDKVTMGNDCFVGSGARVCDRATVGDGSIIMGQLVHKAEHTRLEEWGEVEEDPPEVGVKVFIGALAVIVGGVKIGDGAYVAARALVTKDVPAEHIAVGENRFIPKKNWPEREPKAMIARVQK